MPFNPDEKPKQFLTMLVAAGLKIFGNKPWSNEQYFNAAEDFVKEMESRYGKLD